MTSKSSMMKTAATTVAASIDSAGPARVKGNKPTAAAGGANNEIRPFQIDKVPEAQLTEMRRRIKATIWPERETVKDASQGVQLATMQPVAQYWATDYDWRKIEARMNALPQFITEIDGLDIHFIHVRSK